MGLVAYPVSGAGARQAHHKGGRQPTWPIPRENPLELPWLTMNTADPPGDKNPIGFFDEFQQEIDRMNANSALQALLAEREQEAGTIPIEDIRARLG